MNTGEWSSGRSALLWVIALLSLAALRLYLKGAVTIPALILLASPIVVIVRAQSRAKSMGPEAAAEALHGAVITAAAVALSCALLV